MEEPTPSQPEAPKTASEPQAPPPETVKEIHHHHYPAKSRFQFGRIIVGIIIIFIGVVYLAQANGWAGINVNLDWGRLWPLIIVFIGLSMLGGKGWMSGAIGIIITIAILGIAALLIFTPANNSNTAVTTDTVAIIKEAAATSAVLEIKAGAGTLGIKGGATDLVNGTLESNVTKASTNSSISDAVQTATIKEEAVTWSGLSHRTNNMNLALNESLPIKLKLDTGAMSMNIDLKKINAEEITINTGASSMDLALGDIPALAKLDIDAGASSFNISLPNGAGSKIHIDAGLSSKNFPNFKKIDENNYATENYSTAQKKIDLDFDVGVSSININWR
ncbi:MAG: toast rack family protein [Patescibacteria group bacterium]